MQKYFLHIQNTYKVFSEISGMECWKELCVYGITFIVVVVLSCIILCLGSLFFRKHANFKKIFSYSAFMLFLMSFLISFWAVNLFRDSVPWCVQSNRIITLCVEAENSRMWQLLPNSENLKQCKYSLRDNRSFLKLEKDEHIVGYSKKINHAMIDFYRQENRDFDIEELAVPYNLSSFKGKICSHREVIETFKNVYSYKVQEKIRKMVQEEHRGCYSLCGYLGWGLFFCYFIGAFIFGYQLDQSKIR